MSIPTNPIGGLAEVPPAESDAPVGGWPNPRGGYLFFAAFAAIGAGMGSLTPAVLTITLKATEIDPANATSILSIVAGLAGIAGLIAFPVLGRLSDRTTSALGRRRPFLLVGSVLFAIGAVLLVVAGNVPVLIVGDLFTAVGYSAVLVAVTSTIADQVEPGRRGPISSIVGLSLPVGALLGLFVGFTAAPAGLTMQIVLPAVFAVVGPLLFAWRLTDRRLLAEERPHFGWIQVGTTFWVSPRTHPNFAWTWFSRFLIYFGVSALQAYQVFYLLTRLGFDERSVAGAVFLTTLVLTGVALVTAPVAAKISDVVGRRKPFVAVSAVVFGVGLVLAALSTSFPAFLLATAVVGLGQGVYFAVDVALVTQVLPDPKNPAKDLGIMNLANTLTFAVVPLIAPAVLAIGGAGPNYSALFLLGAFAGLLGAVLILPIRRVR
ncbi:MFS transporter [uncultured Amnibacterium sp.]|uniref:MFS transporter n=1 Tax=uncultured Amnibacterium sp. TaxID=1631851 RepID=UPI0035CB469E